MLLWAAAVLATVMLLFTVTPAEFWKAPVNDAVYHGFDPNLVYANLDANGSVVVTPELIDLRSNGGSVPTALLATTLLPKLSSSVSVSVLDNAGAQQPLRIGIWSPWTSTGYFVTFGSAPSNQIIGETISNGTPASTLMDGRVLRSTLLGHYKVGDSYVVTLSIDKSSGVIASTVTGSDGIAADDSVNAREFPAIFGNLQTSLAASAGGGQAHSTLQNFVLVLPHQRLWASKVDDPIEKLILVALALAGLLLVGIKITTTIREHGRITRARGVRTGEGISRTRWVWVIGAIATVIYLAGNIFLFPLAGHPFDMGAEKLYAYVASAYGPEQLYYLPNLVSLAQNSHGVPYLETAFPYELVVVYLFASVGWITSALFAGGGSFSPDAVQLMYVIKSINVLFGLLDGFLIFLILRTINVSPRWSLIASALWLFNPAVWFSMSVWGQTHVISLFFVLAAVWFAEKHMPFWAWVALAAACLTRPQMLVFGLLLGIVFLRKFTWRENVSAISWTLIVTFIAWLPLTLAISPSLPVDVMLNNFSVQENGGNEAILTTVSQSAYSLWPLVTFFAHGASGLDRSFTPSAALLVGSLTYQQAGQILTVVALLVVSAALAFRKRARLEEGGYIPLVALGITSFLMLLTGLVATHFLLALPFLILCRRWIGALPLVGIVVIWTVTTLVPMFGEMSSVLAQQQYPILAGQSNAIRLFVSQLYGSDRFINAAIVANLCAVIWLALLIFGPGRPSTRPVTA